MLPCGVRLSEKGRCIVMKREAGQLLREATSSAIAVRAGLLGIVPPRLLPAVWLDADERADVQEIVVAHRESGSGDAETFWLYAENAFYLHCALQRPLETSFWIAFPLPRWKEFLVLVVRLGMLIVFTGPPPAWAAREGAYSPFALVPERAREFVEGFTLVVEHPELPVMLSRWPALW